MTRPIALLLATLVTVAAPAMAHAQNTNSQSRCESSASSRAEGHQEFVFCDESVRGDRDLAQGAATRPQRRLAPTSLIRHRLHFVSEMLKSVENL